MCRNNVCVPLFIHSFPFALPRSLTEAQKFFYLNPNPERINNTADKLRYYRHKNSLLQKDVADYAGIDRSTYIGYEDGQRDYYPLDKLQKIAELYNIEVSDLLDDYNRFLFEGQGQQIKTLRKGLKLTQSDFCQKLGVPLGNYKKWEQESVRIFKSTWEMLYKCV